MRVEPPLTQRDVMRAIYNASGGDRDASVKAYAQAERNGRAVRKKNASKLDADKYASALWKDGITKGWFGQPSRMHKPK